MTIEESIKKYPVQWGIGIIGYIVFMIVFVIWMGSRNG